MAALLAAALLVAWFGLGAGATAAEQAISKDQAAQIATQALPGKVTDVSIERKRGQDLYVVEIVADKDGAETDVLVDPQTGKVLGME